MKILIIDDNQFLASILQRVLEEEGYEVKSAKDGEEGYLTYLLFRPDLVITDIQMPGQNGLEMMKIIRRHNPMVRTIYMSGDPRKFWSPLEKEKELYRASFLEKPFTTTELMSVVSAFSD